MAYPTGIRNQHPILFKQQWDSEMLIDLRDTMGLGSHSWSSYDMSISATFESRAPIDNVVFMTPAGLKSISETCSYSNTFGKTVLQLWTRLQPRNRAALMKTVMKLDQASFSRLAETLASLSDSQFDTLVEVLDYAPLPRVRKYVKVCAMLPTNSSNLHGCKKLHEQGGTTGECSNKSLIDAVHGPGNELFNGLSTRCWEKSMAVEHNSEMSIEPTLWKRVHYDALSMIWEQLARQTFTPRFVFPTQLPNDQGQCYFQGRLHQGANLNAFVALNRSMLAKYQQAFYEHNTWVIGTGCHDTTVRFLDWMDDDALRIESVHLSFCMDDIDGLSDLLEGTQLELEVEKKSFEMNNIDLLERFVSHCDYYSEQLCQSWWMKYSYITYLRLDKLTIDMRNAFGPDDVFLPSTSWVFSLPRFKHGKPSSFIVQAPTSALQIEMDDAFAAIS